jgi:F-type H+-transporting ATPase subunit b
MKLRRVLWMAATPLALTILLSDVASAVAPPAAGEAAVTEVHHGGANPIQNWWDLSRKPPPFGFALLNFAALLFILGKVLMPGIRKLARDRHDQIAKDLAEAARLRDEARRKFEELTTRLANLDNEIDRLSVEIRTESEAERKRILAEAAERAERMQRDAEAQIKAEMQAVRVALEREAVLQAVAAAERILREKTTDADQRVLVDRFVKDLEQVAGRGRVGA